jgi:hypothetical protein
VEVWGLGRIGTWSWPVVAVGVGEGLSDLWTLRVRVQLAYIHVGTML